MNLGDFTESTDVRIPRIEDYLDSEGHIVVPDGVTLTSCLYRNITEFGDAAAYRYWTTAATTTETAPLRRRPRVIAVDAVPDGLGVSFVPAERHADDAAYLQYTSGSTRAPAGVEITHRAVCTNVVQMILSVGLDTNVRSTELRVRFSRAARPAR